MPGLRVLLAPCCHWLLHAAVLGNPAPVVIVGFPSYSIWGSPCKHREVPSQLPASWPAPFLLHHTGPLVLCQPPLINHRLGLPAAYLLL